jgi:hypothetical protein
MEEARSLSGGAKHVPSGDELSVRRANLANPLRATIRRRITL